MAQLFSRAPAIVCGLEARTISLTSTANTVDATTYGDVAPTRVGITSLTIRAEFEFLLTAPALSLYHARFPVGEGQFYKHDLGGADVCEYCGTAWLPGTITCPACAGSTSFKARAIEYAARNTGIVEESRLDIPLIGSATLHVSVCFFELTMTSDIGRLFQHDLWGRDAALWICSYCGHMVHGQTAKCPGCGGNRQSLTRLATQQRECLWCGELTTGGYACRACNMRLKGGGK